MDAQGTSGSRLTVAGWAGCRGGGQGWWEGLGG